MAVTVLNPMFMSGKGRLGKIVLYNRKGVQCARSHVIPRNPDTPAQRQNRKSFADAVKLWQELSPEEKYRYNRTALKKRISGYNLFISMYLKENNLCRSTVSGFHVQPIKLPDYDPLRFPSVSHSVQPVYRENTPVFHGLPPVPG